MATQSSTKLKETVSSRLTVPEPPALGAAVAEAHSDPVDPIVEHEEVARLAYSYWEARGCQGGSPEEDWLLAEQQLRAGK